MVVSLSSAVLHKVVVKSCSMMHHEGTARRNVYRTAVAALVVVVLQTHRLVLTIDGQHTTIPNIEQRGIGNNVVGNQRTQRTSTRITHSFLEVVGTVNDSRRNTHRTDHIHQRILVGMVVGIVRILHVSIVEFFQLIIWIDDGIMQRMTSWIAEDVQLVIRRTPIQIGHSIGGNLIDDVDGIHRLVVVGIVQDTCQVRFGGIGILTTIEEVAVHTVDVEALTFTSAEDIYVEVHFRTIIVLRITV